MLIWLLSCALSFSYAQEDILEELNRKRDELNQSLVTIRKNKIRWAKVQSDKVNRKDVLASKPFYAAIAKGTILVNIETEKTFYLTKDITVIAFEKADEDGYRWIESKDGSVKYKALLNEVVDIDLVTQMSEPPQFYKPLKKKRVVESYDKVVSLESELLFHVGYGSANYTKDLIDAHSSSYSQIYKYEFNTIAKWNFPAYLGLSFVRESFFMQTPDRSANGNFYSLGPLVKSPEYNVAKTKMRFFTSYRYGINNQMSIDRPGDEGVYRFHLNSMNLGTEFLSQNSFGQLSFGFNFQRQWLKPIKNKESLNIGSTTQFDESLTIFIGQSWDYTWL